MSARNWLLQRAAQTPDAPALESDGLTLSFAQLAARACAGAAHVLAHAAPGRAPLALLLPGDALFAIWFHAVALAGRCVLPLNLRLTSVELARQLADARVDWLLGAADDERLDELAHLVPGLHVMRASVLETPAVLQPTIAATLPGATIDAQADLAVLFTSGTTGRAKGVRLSGSNFEASALAAAERLGPAVNGRWLACMPLFHVGGLSILLRSALFGGPVRLQSHFDAAAVSTALDAGDIVAVSLVPTMLARLLEHRGARPAPPALRVLLLGGAATPPPLLRRALEAGYPVCTTYGLTEAASQVATAAPPRRDTTDAPPMLPLAGTQVRIAAAGAGVPGEITVRGPTVMQGYLNDLDATSCALRDGWLYTGDIGYLDAAGGLHVLDRRDDLVISGGENVSPSEVEAVLLEHPAVIDAGVAGVPHADLGARVVAWVVLRADVAVDAAVLDAFCRTRLAGFKRPRDYRFVAALPRSTGGKLQRRRLLEIQT
jgi:O-succinylbenzoic acid--CoA ligase